MINSGLGTFLTLAVLGAVAVFGYYNGFLAILKRQATVDNKRLLKGWQALAVGLFQISVAICASAIAILFYFVQVA